MTIVIINPVFYKLWDQMGLYAYWRILWIVPVIPVVAAVVPMITEKMQKPWMKGIAAIAGTGAVIIAGTFLYKGPGGSFVKASNAAKLPDNVVRIADRLLEQEERPRVIVQDPIGVYIRQYTGNITTLYGRDIGNNFISTPSSEAVTVHRTLSNPEIDNTNVAQLMLDDSFDYLVYHGDPGQRFVHIDTVTDYGIYVATGKPGVLKTRNELGQVVSITTVDESGTPIDTVSGYAMVEREYDGNGYVSIEKFSNCNGKPVYTSSGYSTVHRLYDYRGRVTKEQYYGIDGSPMRMLAGHVAIEMEYDKSGRVISRKYLDDNGKPVDRIDGYAKVEWNTDDGRTVQDFYKADESKIEDIAGLNLAKDIRMFPDGWSEKMTPEPNKENCYFVLGTANLGEKTIGDTYTCQVEIEFKDVTTADDGEFRFASQGRGDGSWQKGSIWNSKLVWTNVAPEDGVYRYTNTVFIDESTMNVSNFELGFRCDNWKSGSFRVRNIKVEKGDTAREWSPGI